MFLLLSIYWIVPESIRWLIDRKRYDEPRGLLQQAAEMNGKVIPPQLLTSRDDQKSINSRISNLNEKKDTFLDSLRSPVIFKHLVIMILVWIGTLMGYYGITFSPVTFSGDFHMNYLLSMIIEFPCSFFGVIAVERLGRRPTLCGCLILGGITCMIVGFIPKDLFVLRIVASLIAKFFITTVLATIYSYTAELFPTSSRSTAVGLCSTASKIGGVVAP